MSAGHTAEIVIARPEKTMLTKQRLPNFVGLSEVSAGAKGLSMNLAG